MKKEKVNCMIGVSNNSKSSGEKSCKVEAVFPFLYLQGREGRKNKSIKKMPKVVVEIDEHCVVLYSLI